MLAAAVVATFVVSSSRADEWSVTPSVSIGTIEDDNVYLRPVDPLRVTSAYVDAAAEVVARDTGAEFRFTPRVHSIRYDDDRVLDRDDVSADVSFAKHDDRQQWNVGGGYTNEGTLQSDFETSGLARVDLDRKQTSFSGSFARSIHRGYFAFSGSVAKIDYEESFVSPYRDYQYEVLQGSYSRTTTERSSWKFSITSMQVNTLTFKVTTSSTDVRSSWSHAFSKALQVRVGLGILYASTDGVIGAERSAPSLDFRVDRERARWSLYATGGRELQPDSRGSLQRQDSVQLGVTRRLNERLTVGANMVEGRIDDVGTFFDRDYGQVGASLQWRVRRRWYVDGGLYERREQWSEIPAATGLSARFSATYHGP